MLNKDEAKITLEFLDRTDIKGREAFPMVVIQQKLKRIANPQPEAPKAPEVTLNDAE